MHLRSSSLSVAKSFPRGEGERRWLLWRAAEGSGEAWQVIRIMWFMSVGSLNGGRRSALPLPPPAMCPPVPLEPQDAGGGTAGEVTVATLPKAWRHIRSLTVPLLLVGTGCSWSSTRAALQASQLRGAKLDEGVVPDAGKAVVPGDCTAEDDVPGSRRAPARRAECIVGIVNVSSHCAACGRVES